MNRDEPLVSVLMTAYNREQYIAEAIESVINSTYQNWELIIVDDGSKDNTVAIAKTYADKDGRIKFYRNETNLGDYPNRNKAAGYAKGEYIVIIDSDDWMFKDALEIWILMMEKHGANFGMLNQGYFKETTLLSPNNTIQEHFFKQPILMNGPGATIIKNDYFKKINGFPEKYGPANDMYYNLKAASQTEMLFIPIPLGDYRRHDGQEINNRYSYLYNNYRYLRDALIELDLALSCGQVKYLQQKNKRRFFSNCIRYLIESKSITKTIRAVYLSGFTFRDVCTAIFNKKYKLR